MIPIRRSRSLTLLVIGVLLAGAVGAVAFIYRPKPVLEPVWVRTNTAAVRIDKVEITDRVPTGATGPPPQWMWRYTWLAKLWVRTHQKYDVAQQGLEYVVITGLVQMPNPNNLGSDRPRILIDCGSFTMGTNRHAYKPSSLGVEFQAQGYITAGTPVVGVVVSVDGHEVKIPFPVRPEK